MVSEFDSIAARAEKIFNRLPAEKRDAFYQLVWFPAKASALVNELYTAAARNNIYAKQERAGTNDWADETQRLFRADTSLMGYFNRDFAQGRWNHFMDQPHLGYMSWRDPPVNSLQHITLKSYEPSEGSDMGVAIEGSENSWPDSSVMAVLPEFDVFNSQSRYVDIYNKGENPFPFTISGDAWIRITESKGTVDKDLRSQITIDWDKLPDGMNKGVIAITGTGKTVNVSVNAWKPENISSMNREGFIEANGYVSMEAPHFSKNTGFGVNRWLDVEDFGHTLSGMRATTETEVPEFLPGKSAPCLEYNMFLFSEGEVEVIAYAAPTLNFLPGRAMRYGISFDDGEPQIITLVPEDFDARNGNRDWEKTVCDNYRITVSRHNIKSPGYHTLKIWMMDPGPVIQKIVVNTGGLKPSYLGPPESFYRGR